MFPEASGQCEQHTRCAVLERTRQEGWVAQVAHVRLVCDLCVAHIHTSTPYTHFTQSLRLSGTGQMSRSCGLRQVQLQHHHAVRAVVTQKVEPERKPGLLYMYQ